MTPMMDARRHLWFRVLVVLGLFYVAAFLICAGARLLYPYEVDYTESALVSVLARMARGEPIYAPPGLHFTSMVYTPLNFHVASLLDRLHPGGYIGLRLTSILSTLWTALVIICVARRHKAPLWATMVALGVFFGAYTRTALAQDHAHVDALALAFSLTAMAVVFEARKTLAMAVLAGVIAGLGIVTKQTMVVFVAMPAVWMLLHGQKTRAVVFAVAALTTAVGLLAYWGHLRNPWFYFWVFKLESGAHIRARRMLVEAPLYMLLCLPAGLLVGVLAKLGSATADPEKRPFWVRWPSAWWADPWAVNLLGFAGLAAIARAKDGGGYNVFLPLFAMAAIQLARHAPAWVERRPRTTLALLVLQLLVLVYIPSLFVPMRRDREVVDKVIAQIRNIPGEVYVPAYPEYAVRAGKSWWVHYTLVCGLAQFDTSLRNALGDEIRAQHFAAIIPHADVEPKDVGLCDLPDLEKYYMPGEAVEMPPGPSLSDILTGHPSAAGIAHGGKLARIWVPRPQNP